VPKFLGSGICHQRTMSKPQKLSREDKKNRHVQYIIERQEADKRKKARRQNMQGRHPGKPRKVGRPLGSSTKSDLRQVENSVRVMKKQRTDNGPRPKINTGNPSRIITAVPREVSNLYKGLKHEEVDPLIKGSLGKRKTGKRPVMSSSSSSSSSSGSSSGSTSESSSSDDDEEEDESGSSPVSEEESSREEKKQNEEEEEEGEIEKGQIPQRRDLIQTLKQDHSRPRGRPKVITQSPKIKPKNLEESVPSSGKSKKSHNHLFQLDSDEEGSDGMEPGEIRPNNSRRGSRGQESAKSHRGAKGQHNHHNNSGGGGGNTHNRHDQPHGNYHPSHQHTHPYNHHNPHNHHYRHDHHNQHATHHHERSQKQQQHHHQQQQQHTKREDFYHNHQQHYNRKTTKPTVEKPRIESKPLKLEPTITSSKPKQSHSPTPTPTKKDEKDIQDVFKNMVKSEVMEDTTVTKQVEDSGKQVSSGFVDEKSVDLVKEESKNDDGDDNEDGGTKMDERESPMEIISEHEEQEEDPEIVDNKKEKIFTALDEILARGPGVDVVDVDSEEQDHDDIFSEDTDGTSSFLSRDEKKNGDGVSSDDFDFDTPKGEQIIKARKMSNVSSKKLGSPLKRIMKPVVLSQTESDPNEGDDDDDDMKLDSSSDIDSDVSSGKEGGDPQGAYSDEIFDPPDIDITKMINYVSSIKTSQQAAIDLMKEYTAFRIEEMKPRFGLS